MPSAKRMSARSDACAAGKVCPTCLMDDSREGLSPLRHPRASVAGLKAGVMNLPSEHGENQATKSVRRPLGEVGRDVSRKPLRA